MTLWRLLTAFLLLNVGVFGGAVGVVVLQKMRIGARLRLAGILRCMGGVEVLLELFNGVGWACLVLLSVQSLFMR